MRSMQPITQYSTAVYDLMSRFVTICLLKMPCWSIDPILFTSEKQDIMKTRFYQIVKPVYLTCVHLVRSNHSFVL